MRTALISIDDVDVFTSDLVSLAACTRPGSLVGEYVSLRPIMGGMAERAPHSHVARTAVIPVAVPSLDELAADPARFDGLSASEQAALYAQVAGLEARMRAVLLLQPRGAPSRAPASEREDDELLSLDDAAQRLGVAVPWLRRRAKTLPFTRKLSHKVVRFSARGLDRWQATRRPPLDQQ